MRNILYLVAAAALGTGCYATGEVAYSGGATVTAVDVEGPELVEVSPGVQVVYDYDEPIFFSDGFYWRYSGNVWYRSRVHTGGFTVYSSPPRAIVSIREPYHYRHYRPANYTPRRAVERDHRTYREPARRETVRDHRTPTTYAPPRREVERDHRTPTTYTPARDTSRDHRAPAKKDEKRKYDERDHRK